MATLFKEVRLPISAEKLWSKVADVGGVSNLLEVVTHCSLDGDKRSCRLADGSELSETILGIDPKHRRVAYTITKAPFPLEAHASSMEVVDEGSGGAALRWITDVKPDSTAEMLGPMFDEQLAKLKQRLS